LQELHGLGTKNLMFCRNQSAFSNLRALTISPEHVKAALCSVGRRVTPKSPAQDENKSQIC
jgi:hypothetical protein